MRQVKKLILFILCGSFLHLGVSCHQPNQSLKNSDTALTESFLKTYKDSLMQKPNAVIDTCLHLRNSVTDSLSFYRLSGLLVKAYYFSNRANHSFDLNQQIINYCEAKPATNDLSILAADAYNSRGIFLLDYSLRDSAVTCFKKAYELLETTTERYQLIDICINLADCSQQAGDHTQSSYYYRKALSLTDSLKEGETYNFPIFSGLAKLYQELENFDLAAEYYEKAAQNMAKSTAYEKFFYYNSYGNFCYITKNYDRSLEAFRQALYIAQNLPEFSRGIASANLGEVFILKEQTDSARHYLKNARLFFGDAIQQPSVMFYMNGLNASLALLENDLPEAEKLLKQPYDASLISPLYLYFHHKRLHELYLKKKDFRKAYQYFTQTAVYDDSIRNIKTQNNIAEIDSRYRQDTLLIRKDMQIALTESKASQWKNIATLSMVLLVLFVILVIGVILYRRKLRELKHQKQIVTITGLRMEIVRNRLSPHFIFNALNTIMPALENYRELEGSFRLLIQLLRSNLQASERTAIPFEQEIGIVRDYLRLYSLKKESNISVNWQIDENIPGETCIPSMSIQIPVENAVKYAFTQENEEPNIQIQVTLQNKALQIVTEDNGRGYNPMVHVNDKRGTGSGLKMLYRTIEILNTRNEEKIYFHIENRRQTNPEEKGTRVSLVVPLNYKYEL